MAARIVTRGLQQIGERVSGVSAAPAIQTLSVDGSSTAFAAGDTTLGGPTNEFDKAFDSTPTRSGQDITHVCTLETGEANFLIRRIALHNDTAANVSGSSATLVGGIDSQSITKTSDFRLRITVTVRYTAL